MGALSWTVTPGGLSPADREEILALADRGLTCGPIARRLGKHPATVRWFMYRHGLVAPGLRSSMPIDRPNAAGRKGYGPAEDALIQALRVQGYDLAAIADLTTKRFGHPRSRHGIEVRLIMLSARDDGSEV